MTLENLNLSWCYEGNIIKIVDSDDNSIWAIVLVVFGESFTMGSYGNLKDTFITFRVLKNNEFFNIYTIL